MNNDQLMAVMKAVLSNTSCEDTESAYKIGTKYMLRTVTHIVTGELVRICSDGLVVKDAAWIGSTGRYMQAVASANFDEVEPYPDGAEVIVNWQAMIDAVAIPKLPRQQK